MHNSIQAQLQRLASPEKQAILQRFFKTGKGEYGEGDAFLGVMVPQIRKIAKTYRNLSLAQLRPLLQHHYHECRLCALCILVEQFKLAKTEAERTAIFNFYLENSAHINNWDLVDLSAKEIIGRYLQHRNRHLLYKMAESDNLWEQRMAIIATFAFIRHDDFTDTLGLTTRFLTHKHDLIHKATGWMLREIGKRNKHILYDFLDQHYQSMPRIMLRYAIEKCSTEEKSAYMKSKSQ